MTWKLRTEQDMDSGTASRYFFEDEEGAVVSEGAALRLVKQMIKNYPEAIDALVSEITQEGDGQQQIHQRQDAQEESLTPSVPTPPQGDPYLDGDDEDRAPLDLPDLDPTGGSLSDFAPRPKERDVGQL